MTAVWAEGFRGPQLETGRGWPGLLHQSHLAPSLLPIWVTHKLLKSPFDTHRAGPSVLTLCSSLGDPAVPWDGLPHAEPLPAHLSGVRCSLSPPPAMTTVARRFPGNKGAFCHSANSPATPLSGRATPLSGTGKGRERRFSLAKRRGLLKSEMKRLPTPCQRGNVVTLLSSRQG